MFQLHEFVEPSFLCRFLNRTVFHRCFPPNFPSIISTSWSISRGRSAYAKGRGNGENSIVQSEMFRRWGFQPPVRPFVFFSPQLPMENLFCFRPIVSELYIYIKSHLQRSWRGPSSNDFFVSSPVALLLRVFPSFISTCPPIPADFLVDQTSRNRNRSVYLPNIQIKMSSLQKRCGFWHLHEGKALSTSLKTTCYWYYFYPQ